MAYAGSDPKARAACCRAQAVPTRQWTAAYIEQLAGIARDVLGRSSVDTPARVAVAEPEVDYESALIRLHDAIALVLRRHPGDQRPWGPALAQLARVAFGPQQAVQSCACKRMLGRQRTGTQV